MAQGMRRCLAADRQEAISQYLQQNLITGVRCETPYRTLTRSQEEELCRIASRLEESFADMLRRLMAQKGLTVVQTYKRAGIDRKLFSKVQAGRGYRPGKSTAIALAVALQLTLEQTQLLLSRAGYTLSYAERADVIISYYIEQGIYDLLEINEALYTFGESMIGA